MNLRNYRDITALRVIRFFIVLHVNSIILKNQKKISIKQPMAFLHMEEETFLEITAPSKAPPIASPLAFPKQCTTSLLELKGPTGAFKSFFA